MTVTLHASSKLEKFDDLWSLGDPVHIELKFRELLPEAAALADRSLYLQLLSQIALTEAMQRKFAEANLTLDTAESFLTPEYPLAKVRFLLEKGRVFQQMALFQQGALAADAENIRAARKLFHASYELSKINNFDFHTANAAHMIAIAAEDTADKIKWNELAITLAKQSEDVRAQSWLGSLENNVGQAYLEAKEYELALVSFKEALRIREIEGFVLNILVARWAVARTTRLLGKLDNALEILLALVNEYDALVKSDTLGAMVQMVPLVRGYVYEDLAEVYCAKTNAVKSKEMASLAYRALSKDLYIAKNEPQRLMRLKEILDK